jgi:hypothetical protein
MEEGPFLSALVNVISFVLLFGDAAASDVRESKHYWNQHYSVMNMMHSRRRIVIFNSSINPVLVNSVIC